MRFANGMRSKPVPGTTYRAGARSVVVLIAERRSDAGHFNWSSIVTTSLQLTYGGVFLAVFANQVGLPVPSVVFLMAAGALSAHGECARASLSCWVFWVAWQGMGYGSGSAASGVRRLCGYSAGSAADPRAAPGMRRKSFAVMVSRYCVWPSFIPGLDAVMPPLGGAEGVSAHGFLCPRCSRQLPLVVRLCRAGLSSSRTNWILQFVGSNISGPPSASRLGFRSFSMPAGGD